MVMKRYIFLLILLCFFFIPKVYATTYDNYNTSYYITIPDNMFDMSSVVDSSGHTIQDVLDDFNSLTSTTYYRVITFTYDTNGRVVGIGIYLYDRLIYSSLNASVYGQTLTGNHSFWYGQVNNINIPYFGLVFIYNGNYQVSNIFDYTRYKEIRKCYTQNTNCNNGTTSPNVSSSNSTGVSNSSDYSVDLSNNNGSILYSSDIPFILKNDHNCSSSANCYYKNVIINNESYAINNTLPTYESLYNPTYTEYEESIYGIGHILVGNVSDITNFKMNLQFDYENSSLVQNMSPYFYVYGRKNNNGDYYSYERLDSCTATNNNKLQKTLSNGTALFEYFPQGITCSSSVDLTQYDNFFIEVQTISSVSGISGIESISYYVNSGNFIITSDSTYHIYDTFNNLTYYFSFLVTTSDSDSNVRFISNNSSVVGCGINLTTKKINNFCFSPYSIGTTTNEGYMIYNMQQYNSNTSDVSILIDDDSIVSFGSNGSNSNSTFSYYNNSGTISSSIIENKLALTGNTNDYDISNYIKMVNDYIDDFRDKIDSFAYLVQNFYNNLPVYFQSLLLISTILLCIYIIYIIIRKW